MQAVTNLLNNDSVSDIDRLRLVMLYALRYEKESPVQLMQLFNKLASRSPKYKPGVGDQIQKASFSCLLLFISVACLILVICDCVAFPSLIEALTLELQINWKMCINYYIFC